MPSRREHKLTHYQECKDIRDKKACYEMVSMHDQECQNVVVIQIIIFLRNIVYNIVHRSRIKWTDFSTIVGLCGPLLRPMDMIWNPIRLNDTTSQPKRLFMDALII